MRARRFRVESRWFGEVIAIWVEMAFNYCLSLYYAHRVHFKGSMDEIIRWGQAGLYPSWNTLFTTDIHLLSESD